MWYLVGSRIPVSYCYLSSNYFYILYIHKLASTIYLKDLSCVLKEGFDMENLVTDFHKRILETDSYLKILLDKTAAIKIKIGK